MSEKARLTNKQMRRAMQLSIRDGMAANMSENMFGPFLALYALALGASKSEIGLLSALPALLGNIMQIPAAMLTERLGRRKIVSVISGTGSRLTIFAIFLLPFFNLGHSTVYVFVALVALRGLVGSIGAPGWTAIMADITPKRLRGSFFSTRNILASLTGLTGTLAAGWIIKTYGFPYGYQWTFLIAFILGIISLFFFARIPVIEPRDRKKLEGGKAAEEIHSTKDAALPLKERWQRSVQVFSAHKNFRTYCLTSIFWGFSVSLGGPLLSVYFIEGIGGTAAQWSVSSSAGLLATMLCQKYWGRLADRFGSKNVMIAGGVGAATVPLLWLAVPIPELGPVVSFINSFGWGGYNLAAFNFLLELTPEENRPTFVGVYNTLVGVTTSVAPLLGGIMADLVGIQYVLLASGILRWTSYLTFVRKVDGTNAVKMRPSDLIPGLGNRRVQQRGSV